MAAKNKVAKVSPPPEVIDVPAPIQADEMEVATVGRQVLDFFKGLSGFIGTARALELNAKQQLDVAKSLAPPKNAAEDVAIQRVAVHASEDLKRIQEHWNPITSGVHRLHKTLTGARGRAEDMVEQRRKIANAHHNAYTQAANRRAQEEEDRLNREAEERARQERERETARAEEEAIRREAASKDLSDREQTFVHRIVQGDGPTNAARTAGFKNPAEAGERLMKTKKIETAIAGKREAETIRTQAAAAAAKPLEVQRVEVKPDIERATGAHDRTTKSAEIIDADAFVAAVIKGGMGIPWDVLAPVQAKLNEYARSIGPAINRWPGVRYKEETGVTR